MRLFLHALEFFTRIRQPQAVLAWRGFSPEALAQCLVHLPGGGWVIGLLCALLWLALVANLPAVDGGYWVAAILSTAWGLWLTGALHEDGLADLTDGLGGSMQRERALDIMKDSRVGAYGVAAMCLALLLKCALLVSMAQIDPWLTALALVAGHVHSRFFALLMAFALPHVGDVAQSKSHGVSAQVGLPMVTVASLWCGLFWVVCFATSWPDEWSLGLMGAVVAAGLGWLWMRHLLWARLQGFTGDALGAVQQVCELLGYLGVLVTLGLL